MSMEASNAGGREQQGPSIGAPETSRFATGLECRIGRARLAIPMTSVDRIIEYKISPLPLARQWIGGIGVHEGMLVISVALVAGESHRTRGAFSKGIILNVANSQLGWALEVHETFSFVRATVLPRRKEADSQLPGWITGAKTDEGRSIGWIHVPAMLAELAQLAE